MSDDLNPLIFYLLSIIQPKDGIQKLLHPERRN